MCWPGDRYLTPWRKRQSHLSPDYYIEKLFQEKLAAPLPAILIQLIDQLHAFEETIGVLLRS